MNRHRGGVGLGPGEQVEKQRSHAAVRKKGLQAILLPLFPAEDRDHRF